MTDAVSFAEALTGLQANKRAARAAWGDDAEKRPYLTLFPGREDSDPLLIKTDGAMQTSSPVIALGDVLATDWIVTEPTP